MKVISWGLLGTGTMAGLFVESLARVPGARINAVASRSLSSANSFAAKHKISSAFDNFEELLNTVDVDVIYISTPNEHHHQHCQMALSAGKAILCEKPFALCAADAVEVIDLARKRRLFCMEAMWMRFSPAVQEVINYARQGKLGKLQFFSGQLGFPYLKSDHQQLFRMPGGGALLDLGVYPLSLAQSLFGGSAEVLTVANVNEGGADEQFSVILKFAGGAQAAIAASLKAKLANSASIHGELGVLELDEPLYFPEGYRWQRTASHSARQRSSVPSALRRFPPVKALADWKRRSAVKYVSRRVSHGGYYLEAAEVQRCLQSGLIESPVMPWADTLETLKLMDLIRDQWAAKLS